jgi:hypothetical protein
MSEKDDLDLLLDAALRSYADPGADSGLEQRILQRIQKHPSRLALHPWRNRLLWAAGISLAASCLLLAVVSTPPREMTPSSVNPHASVESRLPQLHATNPPHPLKTTPLRRKRSGPLAIPEQTLAPKLAVFPTPTPLSPQERALVHLVSGATAVQRKDFVAAQQQDDTPLRIAAISIPSLEPPETGKE